MAMMTLRCGLLRQAAVIYAKPLAAQVNVVSAKVYCCRNTVMQRADQPGGIGHVTAALSSIWAAASAILCCAFVCMAQQCVVVLRRRSVRQQPNISLTCIAVG